MNPDRRAFAQLADAVSFAPAEFAMRTARWLCTVSARNSAHWIVRHYAADRLHLMEGIPHGDQMSHSFCDFDRVNGNDLTDRRRWVVLGFDPDMGPLRDHLMTFFAPWGEGDFAADWLEGKRPDLPAIHVDAIAPWLLREMICHQSWLLPPRASTDQFLAAIQIAGHAAALACGLVTRLWSREEDWPFARQALKVVITDNDAGVAANSTVLLIYADWLEERGGDDARFARAVRDYAGWRNPAIYLLPEPDEDVRTMPDDDDARPRRSLGVGDANGHLYGYKPFIHDVRTECDYQLRVRK